MGKAPARLPRLPRAKRGGATRGGAKCGESTPCCSAGPLSTVRSGIAAPLVVARNDIVATGHDVVIISCSLSVSLL